VCLLFCVVFCLGFFLGGFEISRQGVELVLPEDAIVLDPAGGVFHGLGSEAAAVDAAVDFAAQQAGALQDAQMLGHGRERDVEGRGELGDCSFAEGQAGEDGSAGGIGEGAEGGVEQGGVGERGERQTFNHMV
jgi:hypothetical protein